MSSGGNFDDQSVSRISRVVRYVEGGWPVGTRRTRRPPQSDPGNELIIVRLIENVPPAKLYPAVDDFYDRFREAIGDRLPNEIAPGELLSIGAQIINTYTDDINATGSTVTDRFFGSGLAWLCEFEPGRNREALEQGAVENILVRYTEVERVWNMHARAYNTIDGGGIFGNEAGGLGGGFCNAIRGFDGELWLVEPDRQLIVAALSSLNDLTDSLTAVSTDLLKVKAFLNGAFPGWDD